MAEIFWLAHGLPEPERHHVQELARSYAEEVVDEEWPLMEQGQASPRGWILIDDIRATLQGYEPHTVAEEGLVLGSPNAACPDQRPPVPSRSPHRAGRQESFKYTQSG